MNLKKVNNEFEILELNEDVLYTITNGKNIIKIYSKEVLENIIDNNFNKKYKELLYIVMSINEDEDGGETDINLALLKIEDLRNYLLNYYSKYLSKTSLNKY